MNNKKISSLLNKGIKFESLKMLNETQINTLYNAVIGEQESLTDKGVPAVEKLRKANAELQNDIKNTIALVGEEDSEEEEVVQPTSAFEKGEDSSSDTCGGS